ncbi:MAG TPA: LamG-like jellyroll fold domain-containing protein [Planctomycetota bacterium]|nr:LamG-like jellyroll fold domain-containing protein [Planctomycetota bacterium]
MLIATLTFCLSLQADAPVAQWSFDGDVRDSGASSFPTKTFGKLEYFDSPVGKSGKLAVFNGVDTYLEVTPPAELGAGSGDFGLSAWVVPLDRRPAPLFSRKGWSLALTEGGGLLFKSDCGSITAPGGSCAVGQWCHVYVNVRRADVKGNSLISVNGDVVGIGDLREGNLDPPGAPLLIGKGDDGKLFGGLLDDVRLYGKAMDSADVSALTDAGMPWLRVGRAGKKDGFGGKFELATDDVVAFVGGEDARVGQELGYLEALLTLSPGGKKAHYRNMAWEGDTVYEQLRPLNFGTWTDQFRRHGVSVVFCRFGQVEALQGKDDVPRFEAAYEALLAQFAKTTKRIVLVSPPPFGKGAATGPDLAARNADLALYVEVTRKLAASHGFLFIDLTTPPMSASDLSRDGLHLSVKGQWEAARETARQLEIPGVSDLDAPDARGVFRKEVLETLRWSIRAKNALWTNGWRPSNWAFLNGDRMDQPSSRDHVDRRVRWFPVEVQQYPALVRREEDKIQWLVEQK